MQLPDTNAPFLTFRKFTNPADAQAIAYLLARNKVEIEMEDETGPADYTKPFNVLTSGYILKLKPDDFARADQIIADFYQVQISLADPAYFLFQFTDEELIDVILKVDEWGDYNALLAKSILDKKGIVIPAEMFQGLKKKRIDELRKPEAQGNANWLLYGYFSISFAGIFGVLVGWYIATGKKTLPNGERVYVFNSHDRKHGYRIFTIGLIIFIAIVVHTILTQINFYSGY